MKAKYVYNRKKHLAEVAISHENDHVVTVTVLQAALLLESLSQSISMAYYDLTDKNS